MSSQCNLWLLLIWFGLKEMVALHDHKEEDEQFHCHLGCASYLVLVMGFNFSKRLSRHTSKIGHLSKKC